MATTLKRLLRTWRKPAPDARLLCIRCGKPVRSTAQAGVAKVGLHQKCTPAV